MVLFTDGTEPNMEIVIQNTLVQHFNLTKILILYTVTLEL